MASAGYERLREQVLSGNDGRWRLGCGVLVTRGVAAWSVAWTCPPSSPVPTQPTHLVGAEPQSWWPPAQRGVPSPPRQPCSGNNPIVAALAQMALAHA
jgi:hypothetical protein